MPLKYRSKFSGLRAFSRYIFIYRPFLAFITAFACSVSICSVLIPPPLFHLSSFLRDFIFSPLFFSFLLVLPHSLHTRIYVLFVSFLFHLSFALSLFISHVQSFVAGRGRSPAPSTGHLFSLRVVVHHLSREKFIFSSRGCVESLPTALMNLNCQLSARLLAGDKNSFETFRKNRREARL